MVGVNPEDIRVFNAILLEIGGGSVVLVLEVQSVLVSLCFVEVHCGVGS